MFFISSFLTCTLQSFIVFYPGDATSFGVKFWESDWEGETRGAFGGLVGRLREAEPY